MFVLITFFSPKLPNIRSYKHVDIPALSLQNPYLVESKSSSTPSTTTNVTTNKPTNSQGDKTELPARRSTRIFNQPGHGFPIFGYSVTDSVIENVKQKYNINYRLTHSSVATLAKIGSILSITVQNN